MKVQMRASDLWPDCDFDEASDLHTVDIFIATSTLTCENCNARILPSNIVLRLAQASEPEMISHLRHYL